MWSLDSSSEVILSILVGEIAREGVILNNRNPLNAYKETTIKTASKSKLVLMLYDEAIKQIDASIEMLESGSKKLDRVHNAIVKAQDVITELMVSLDFEKGGEIAKNLLSLYMYFNNELLKANMNKELGPLTTVRPFLMDLRTAWKQIIDNNTIPESGTNQGVNVAG